MSKEDSLPTCGWRGSFKRSVLLAGLICVACIAALILGLNWRRIEARYWIWRYRRAEPGEDAIKVVKAAWERRYVLKVRGTPRVERNEQVYRVFLAYEHANDWNFPFYEVFTSHDEGKSWQRGPTSEREFNACKADTSLVKEVPGGFVVGYPKGDTWVSVHKFSYPSVKVIDVQR